MRIAYLTGTYPRATDTFIQREVAGLRSQGVEVHTFAVRRPSDDHIVGPEQASERSQTFYILPPKIAILLKAHGSLFLRSPGRYLRAIALALKTRQPDLTGLLYQLFYFLEAGVLAAQIRERQISHLHNHFGNTSCSVAMLAAALGGFSYSFMLHGPAIFFEPNRWCLDEKIERASFVTCISQYCRSQAMVFAPYETWNRLHIVHCGVNPAQFSQVTHQGAGHRLLFVGRLAAVKGLPMLLESVSQLKAKIPNILLTVVGDGPDRALLESLTTQLDLTEQVNFVGYQSQAAVRRYLQETDVFVLPSFAEGVPVVLMEAMMSGVPVVATQIAGVSELVEDSVSGFLVPPSSVSELCDRIRTLLIDGELRRRFGAQGMARVREQFDISKEAEKLAQLMAAVTAQQAPSKILMPASQNRETGESSTPVLTPSR
ncbi:MAG: glycosyltransferase family 4 protein [Cyanobacteria bacterium J06626_6]